MNLYATGLVPQGWDGKLYGVSLAGGTSGVGTVYSITLGGTPTMGDPRSDAEGSYYPGSAKLSQSHYKRAPLLE